MKKIPLTQGYFAIVDDEDFEWLSQYKWYALRTSRTVYATAKINRKTVLMHRAILNAGPGEESDHADGDGLSNRRVNLRLCTRSQNQHNQRIHKDNTSGFKGVSWHKQKCKWHVQIQNNNKRIHLGYFTDPAQAAQIYNAKAKELFGEFAQSNFHETGI